MTVAKSEVVLTRVKYWRRWYCELRAQNPGTEPCTPDEPHFKQDCAFLWVTPRLTENDMNAIKRRFRSSQKT